MHNIYNYKTYLLLWNTACLKIWHEWMWGMCECGDCMNVGYVWILGMYEGGEYLSVGNSKKNWGMHLFFHIKPTGEVCKKWVFICLVVKKYECYVRNMNVLC